MRRIGIRLANSVATKTEYLIKPTPASAADGKPRVLKQVGFTDDFKDSRAANDIFQGRLGFFITLDQNPGKENEGI